MMRRMLDGRNDGVMTILPEKAFIFTNRGNSANPSIRICSYWELELFAESRATHLITIANPGVTRHPPEWFAGEYLQLWFGDVVSEADAHQYKTRAPGIEDVKKALLFSRVAGHMNDPRLLVSCDYGASRSPALAYVLLADQYGEGREGEAFEKILVIRPEAVPNLLVVRLGDTLLGRSGKLLGPLNEYFDSIRQFV